MISKQGEVIRCVLIVRALLRVIDLISEWTGKLFSWLCIVLIAVMSYEVLMRYVFDAPTIWSFQVSAMLGASFYAMGWAYVHKHNSHIRIDIFYTRLSPRKKAIIDVAGTLLLFIPLFIVLTDVAVSTAWHSWLRNEKMYETHWYPPAAPLRTIVAIAICLFSLEAGARFIRDLYLLVRNKPYD